MENSYTYRPFQDLHFHFVTNPTGNFSTSLVKRLMPTSGEQDKWQFSFKKFTKYVQQHNIFMLQKVCYCWFAIQKV